ncbi:hypothetical protein P7H62_03735 [Vagococcus carniphilus]|uniref:hypothetical protein n=1 Tax=Vagococcus carniphilus TaxID=218144 RepID=UPI00288DFF4E|nr:hypothetical protein [Vagococcus carniphilus]MDT2830281.1 hypothetical protein [Vagococcus carniphilus]MDT2838713.1 hypothetical protein [Vagococcus carniphilus]MDT2853551.1 hypothetical protein [Vagococcus carniphilus]
MEPLKFLVEVTPIPTEEKGGCLGAFILLLIWIFAIWLAWQLLKFLGVILVKYILPVILVVGAIIAVLIAIGKIFDK